MIKKFLRRAWNEYSKLGKRRKKKQTWRRPTGRDNKMREKRKGYPAVVSIGYRKDNNVRGALEGKKPILVNNLKELMKLNKNEIALIGSIGKIKKLELAKYAKEKGIKVYNMNASKFLKINLKKNKKSKETSETPKKKSVSSESKK